MNRKKDTDTHKHFFSIFAPTVVFEVLELLKPSDLPESALLKLNREPVLRLGLKTLTMAF